MSQSVAGGECRHPGLHAGHRFIAPCFALIPPNSRNYLCNIAVPRDDDSTTLYFVHFREVVDLDVDMIQTTLGMRPGIDLDANGIKIRNRDNNFLRDRNAMARGNFSGIHGIGNQYIAMWESMGRRPIIDRSLEHLGATDIAVVQFRRLMVDAVTDFRDTARALGQHGPQVPLAKVRSYEGLHPKGTNWESLGLSEEERALAAREIPALSQAVSA
ncbi:MAG TPA: hypothetical protein VN823_13140 [Stellaceae bacterium]|nr:hypothetical protein [Stellaceae bacterium]